MTLYRSRPATIREKTLFASDSFKIQQQKEEVFKIQQQKEEVYKIQQEKERRRYSKSSKREREKEVFKIQQERWRQDCEKDVVVVVDMCVYLGQGSVVCVL